MAVGGVMVCGARCTGGEMFDMMIQMATSILCIDALQLWKYYLIRLIIKMAGAAVGLRKYVRWLGMRVKIKKRANPKDRV